MAYHPEYKDNTHKSKKTKRKTECSVLRRQNGCGICGSKNLVIQGVKYCKKCGIEKEFLQICDGFSWYWKTGVKLSCKCLIGTNPKHRYRPTETIGVHKCIDCGAVKSSYCPNCEQRTCWKSWDGKLFCQSCGFRTC